MDAIQKALDAIEKGEDYQFKTEHKTESTYELVVKEGKLEMTIYPAIYAVIHDQPVKLQFSKDELERLTKTSTKVTQRMEWIEKNMTLFFRKK